MRARRLSELVDLMQPAAVELVGDDLMAGPDVVLDNRLATPGSVFVAIPGARVDGHSFAPQAVEAGSAAVLGNHVTEADVPHLLVADTVEGLSWLGRGVVREARARGLVSLGITGSSGKTSTKDLLAQVLEQAGPAVAPSGSQNNEIGVPLTACRVTDETRFLVSEMGSRGRGHIAWLTSLVGLDIGVVLNVGAAHVGEFGGLEQTAVAKSEIIAGLGSGGWAVLNADDAACRAMRGATSARVAWFGEADPPPDGDLHVRATDVHGNALAQCSFTLHVTHQGQTSTHAVSLQVVGRHQVSNALAAAAAAVAAGVEPGAVASALSRAMARSSWRMELTRGSSDQIILNDAYNANPDSMAAALRTTADLIRAQREVHGRARSIAVLGDMLELGEDAQRLHAQLGALAGELGIDEVVGVGDYAEVVASAARQNRASSRVATRDEAADIELGPGDVLLVKGSRGIGLELVAEAVAVRSKGEQQ